MFKCEQLLSIHNIHDLCNLGKYINFAFKSREGIFSESYTQSNISNINVICFFFCIITKNIFNFKQYFIMNNHNEDWAAGNLPI